MTLRTASYGGGVQSTAMLVLAAQGEIDFPIFLFANTGDDSENPKSLVYVREVAMPYAAVHGIELHEIKWERRDGRDETLWQKLTREDSRSTGIPVRLGGSGAPANRSCTSRFKIEVIAKWQRQHGATKETPAVAGLGISLDEIHRARTDSRIATQTLEYPLIDLRMTRQDCVNTIERAGLPVPGKSSCFFCPFHTRAFWARQQREEPELFAKSVLLERTLSERSVRLGHGPVFMTDALIPLDMAIVDAGQQEFDFEPFACAGGASCMT
jgi:hypothetical protein